jgi:phosphoesterase RecJ-like protein
MRPIQDAFSLLQTPKKIFITTHHKPDGDAIGSMLGLYHYLIKKGHKPTAVSPGEIPDFLEWMPGVNTMLNFEAQPNEAKQALTNADLIFCLDFNDYSRTKHLEQLLADATQPKILIDHHLFPKPVWDYGISLPEKSSTAEMVYDFINMNGDHALLDLDIQALSNSRLLQLRYTPWPPASKAWDSTIPAYTKLYMTLGAKAGCASSAIY